MGRVLNELVRLDGAHSWTETGQWINLIPLGRENDPNYWMNQRLEATVKVRAESTSSEPESAWRAVWHNVATVVDASGISSTGRLKAIREVMECSPGTVAPRCDTPFRPGEIVLHNPTVREVINARVYLMGFDGYSVKTTESGGPEGNTRSVAVFRYRK